MPAPAPVECCGKPRTSRFCPECGNPLQDAPLVTLLAHLRSVQKQYRTDLEKELEWAVAHPDHPSNQRDAVHAKRRVAKWTSWADALAELIERDRVAKPD